MIRVALPFHLRTLARVGEEIEVEASGAVTLGGLIDAIEAKYPALRGAIRDYSTRERRPFLRFFASNEDISHQPLDALLPDAIAKGDEPLLIVGAIAGG
jgi:molybdopterin synthase sulfur carrier subunit